jgi:hypothetical protein
MRDAPPKTAGKLSKFALSGLVLGVGSIAVLAASGIGYRLGWWPVGTALNTSEWAVYAAALGLVVSAIGAILSRPGARQRGFLLSLLGIVASLPVVAIALQWEYAARTYPPINTSARILKTRPFSGTCQIPLNTPVHKRPHCSAPPTPTWLP